ncbi:probable cyclin-dependent serine/threonine-protein kinase DDB_G0292550 [Sitodiplosis mosellana]|uniref:probable cyclin-dependent serine/threonine-protein kinase DDB_G0292550 n=1 Tax=Sitodiplosis mosellana TaxID=263140 RepID=UPI0024441981|nr:probable cyclin-dependent serine/threonine-protein kinase DDB_G0292550 [Sitodiplosis mosellana]
MLALKLSKNTSQQFAEEAEKLADDLQHSLVFEGISLEKAKEMAIESTVKMCRQSARSDLVRSVLAAASFKDPKEVIAKLITGESTHEQEKQVLAYNRQGGFRKNNGRFNNGKKWNNQNGNKNFNQNNGKNGGYKKNYNGRGNYNKNKGNYNVRVTENCEGPSNGDGQNQNNQQTLTLERANNRS